MLKLVGLGPWLKASESHSELLKVTWNLAEGCQVTLSRGELACEPGLGVDRIRASDGPEAGAQWAVLMGTLEGPGSRRTVACGPGALRSAPALRLRCRCTCEPGGSLGLTPAYSTFRSQPFP